METVADQFAETLAAACVKRVYGIYRKARKALDDLDLAKTNLWR